MFKKMFGGIKLTWKKLILFAVIAGVYTALMALLPFTYETSFRDIAIQFEWWILMGILIISNSKSPKDSALKCFVFFLISQPLIYLIQVPFSSMGWELFKFYKYWFMWTVLCLPMGFFGYYINKKNWLSVLILTPMLILLAYLGLGYLSAVIEHFPHHLLSCISCFGIILIVVFYLFDKKIYKIVSLSIVTLFVIAFLIFKGGIINKEYETFRSLDDFGIEFVGDISITMFTGTAKGNAEVAANSEEYHTVKLNGRENGKYTFEISDDSKNVYTFEYYFDKENNTIVLNKTN